MAAASLAAATSNLRSPPVSGQNFNNPGKIRQNLLQLTLVISFDRARLKAGRWRSSPRRFPSGQGGNPFPQPATPAEFLIASLPEFQSDRHLSVSSVAATESYAEYLLTAATTPNFSSSKCDQSKSYDAKSVYFDVHSIY